MFRRPRRVLAVRKSARDIKELALPTPNHAVGKKGIVPRNERGLMSATAATQAMLAEHGYVADRQVVMSVYLAQTLERPLLIEGPAGVGKTEVAKVVARALDTELIRLQCYEGLDAHAALYEWNYQRQLLHLKLDENSQRPLQIRVL